MEEKTSYLRVGILFIFGYVYLHWIFDDVIAVVILLFIYYIFHAEFEWKQQLSASLESD